MNNTKKRAFTIVELVIVIAVIAILAAVLIPTFSNVIAKANYSNDLQVCRNMNTTLFAEFAKDGNNSRVKATDALKAAKFENSFVPKSDGYHFYWCETDNNVYLVDDSDSGFTVKFPEGGVATKEKSYRLDEERKTNTEKVTANYVYDNDTKTIKLSVQGTPDTAKYGEIEYAIAKNNNVSSLDESALKAFLSDKWSTQVQYSISEEDKENYIGYARYSGNNEYAPGPIDYESCFVAGSKVTMADGSKKNIEEVKVGDSVLAYDVVNGVSYETVVLKTIEGTSSAISKVMLSNGIYVECTPSHPLLTTEGFKSVDPAHKDVVREYASTKLCVGDLVVTSNGTFAVESIETRTEVVSVYTFHVKSNGEYVNCTYYVNDIVAHNASGG